jgi:hypothetical protein
MGAALTWKLTPPAGIASRLKLFPRLAGKQMGKPLVISQDCNALYRSVTFKWFYQVVEPRKML